MHFGVQEYGENLECGNIDLIGTEVVKMGCAATILKSFGATQFV